MRLFVTLTRSKLLAVTLFILLIVAVFGKFSAVNDLTPDADTNQKRVDFAAGIGCEVDETAVSVKEIKIPQKFTDVYEKYNDLQKESGFDLSMYKGCDATIYTYKVIEGGISGEETVVNLIVYKGRVIGGDISSVAIDGQMLPLKKG